MVEGCSPIEHELPISHDGVASGVESFELASKFEVAGGIKDVDDNIIHIQGESVAGLEAGGGSSHGCYHEGHIFAREVGESHSAEFQDNCTGDLVTG